MAQVEASRNTTKAKRDSCARVRESLEGHAGDIHEFLSWNVIARRKRARDSPVEEYVHARSGIDLTY